MAITEVAFAMLLIITPLDGALVIVDPANVVRTASLED